MGQINCFHLDKYAVRQSDCSAAGGGLYARKLVGTADAGRIADQAAGEDVIAISMRR